MTYAKAVVAVAGAALTAALGIFPQGSAAWNVCTILAAAFTALAVYFTPNAPSE